MPNDKASSSQVETVKKFAAGSNKTGAGQDAAKLDRETEELHHDRSALQLSSSRRVNGHQLFGSLC